MHVEGPKKFLARWYPGILGQEAWLTLETRLSPTCVTMPNLVALGQATACLTLRNTALPTCYHAKFGRPSSNHMNIRGPKKFGGRLAPPPRMGHYDPRNMPPPTCYDATFGCSRSNSWHIITEIIQNSLNLRVLPFKIQGYSRSLELTQINWLPTTSY